MQLKLAGSATLCFWLCWDQSSAQQGAATGEPIVIPTAPLPKAFLHRPYHFKLEAQGGITPLTWEVTAGTPPPGIELAPDGTLSGTPTEVDSFRFVVTVTDSGKPVAQKKKEFTLRRGGPAGGRVEQEAQGDGPPPGSRHPRIQPDRGRFRFHRDRPGGQRHMAAPPPSAISISP